MYKIGNNTVIGAFLGSTTVSKIYLGSTLIYPAVVEVLSGTSYSAWSYSNDYRSRTATPWTQEKYQNNTYGSVVYGTPVTQSEYALQKYLWSGYSYFNNNAYRNRTYTSTYEWSLDEPYVTSAPSGTSANEYGVQSISAWTYTDSITRTRNITYKYDNGNTVKAGGTQMDLGSIGYAIWDGSTYWNGVCGSNYYFIDYKKVRDEYYWNYEPEVTYSDYYNGASRSRRIDGSCGWVKGWTTWTNTGEVSNAAGALNAYDCDGTYSVQYYRQVRYYQYPDGSGRTSTEYRGYGQYSRIQVNGQCGYYSPSRTPLDYYAFSEWSQEDAWNAYIYGYATSGTIWWDDWESKYYTDQNGSTYAQNGFYLTDIGGSPESSGFLLVM